VDFSMIVAALVGSGLLAGVLFGIAVGVLPAFAGLPVDRYVEVHRLLGRDFDRVMPLIAVIATLADIGLVVTTTAWARYLFLAGAVLQLGVSAVSQLGNVPINRVVRSLPASGVPAGWADPRARWRHFHLLRTSFALLALAANAVALALIN
jgi:uncharacterized membrane protein